MTREYGQSVTTRTDLPALAEGLHYRLKSSGLSGVSLLLAGYDETNYYGRIFTVAVPGGVEEHYPHASWGVVLGGDRGVSDALLQTLALPLSHYPPEGAAELARWLIETTVRAQSFSVGPKTVGGPVRMAVLERRRAVSIT